MPGILKKIARTLDAFVRWMWNGMNPPPKKKWCIAHYMVAAEETGLSYPEGTQLNDKMLEAVAAIKAASKASAVQDAHVAYRTIDKDGDKIAEVFSWTLLGLVSLGPKDYEFDGCTDPVSTALETGPDMRCFFEWVYKWCPADHYAFFFWGHSFGPAGLFEKFGTLQVPPPGLAFLRKAFEAFTVARARDLPPTEAPLRPTIAGQMASPGGTGGTGATGTTVLDVVRDFGNAKVELVVFQNCWMSTLETACELKGVAQAAVASQSLVPIGLAHLNGAFVWPFETLFTRIVSESNGRAAGQHVMTILKQFYVSKWNLVTGLSSVPFALVDLTMLTGVTAAVKGLVTSIVGQRHLLENNAIGPTTASQEAGDLALADVGTLCAALATQPPGPITSAANALDQAHKQAVVETFEVGGSLGFAGLSAFLRPAGYQNGNGSYIADATVKTAYEALAFPKTTGWPGFD